MRGHRVPFPSGGDRGRFQSQEHRCWKVERADGDKKQQQDDNLIF